MNIEEIIHLDGVACDVQASSKKRALEELAALLAKSAPDLTQEQAFESLVGRERLGSTGLGHGVAIPHGRISGREQAVGAFVKLAKPVDFDAIDGLPVDLMFALLVPEHFANEHLEILARLAEMFSNREFCDQLRNSNNTQQLFDLLTDWQPRKTSASA